MRIEVDLDLPAGNKQRAFMDGLNATLRSRMSSSRGSAKHDLEGNFISRVIGPFEIANSEFHLCWTLTREKTGVLRSVAVEPVNEAPNDWGSEVHQVITSVLAAALAERHQKYFRRTLFFYVGPQLDGEYWLPGYRFAPVCPDDPEPHLTNAERVVAIDQEIAAVDEMHAHSLAGEAAHRHAARLSLLLNTALYPPQYLQRWVVRREAGASTTRSERLQLGFHDRSAQAERMPAKGKLCSLGQYKGRLDASYLRAGELLSLPRQARKILRGVDHAAPGIADAFDCGARLYQVGMVCGSSFPSVGLAYRVAAVEAVCQAEGVHNSFSEFIRQHVRDRPGLRKILDNLYGSLRSAHFHGGQFPAGEYSRQPMFDPFMDAESVKQQQTQHECYEVTREALVNWMAKLVPDDPMP